MSRAHQYWRMRYADYGRRGVRPPDEADTRRQEIRRWRKRRELCEQNNARPDEIEELRARWDKGTAIQDGWRAMFWLGLKCKMYPAHVTFIEEAELPQWPGPDADPDAPLEVEVHKVELNRWAVAPGETAAWRYTIWHAMFLCSQLTDDELDACKGEWWWRETVDMLYRCPNCGAGWTDRFNVFCPLCPPEEVLEDA